VTAAGQGRDIIRSMQLTEEELATLAQSRLFDGVPIDKIRERLKPSGEVTLRPGAVLLELGQRNAVIYLLVSGKLAIHIDPEARIPVAHVLPGECVGEISIVDDQAASASVVAVERSHLLMTNPDHLWELMRGEHAIALNMMSIFAERIRRNNAAILETLQQQAHLQAISTVDPLTGLFNRRWMNEMFPRQIDRYARDGMPLALAVVDIDHFKAVNDTHGHLGGDRALVQVALAMQRHSRPTDLVARYGGEEFCLLLPDTPLEMGFAALERLRDSLAAAPLALGDGKSVALTISAGVAQWREGWSLDELVHAADEALYRAKREGRNRVLTAP
jgi:diguanylate cyclase (GGDEF)-like protein